MNQIKIKKRKEKDWPKIFRFLACFTYIFGALLIIWGLILVVSGYRLFSFKLLLFLSFLFSVLTAYSIEKLGSGFGAVLSGWIPRKITVRESLSADLEKARFSKREGRFEEALGIISGALDKDPDFPEALYLKAQILWEGFGNSTGAKRCLQKVMQEVPYGETLHRWASSYFDKVIGGEKKRQTHSPSKSE